jgi:hypothetical protein
LGDLRLKRIDLFVDELPNRLVVEKRHVRSADFHRTKDKANFIVTAVFMSARNRDLTPFSYCHHTKTASRLNRNSKMLSHTPDGFAALAAFVCLAFVQCVEGQDQPCNPIKSPSCPPTPGLDKSDYFIDFTNQPSDLSKYWSTSNYATVTYNSKAKNGAEFTIAKRYDAPQLSTNFHILFGRVDIETQITSGIGIISSGVLLSPDGDEIDWEFSGNNFGTKNPQYTGGAAQNNYFGKGVTGIYDCGGWAACASPQTQFHTYSFDWSPTKLDWILDGKFIRTLQASDANTNDHQYPQTPSKIQVGIWDGGDPGLNPGTIGWAGGTTNM